MKTFTKKMIIGGQAYKFVVKFHKVTDKIISKIDQQLDKLEEVYKSQVQEFVGIPNLAQTPFGEELKTALTSLSQDIYMMYMLPLGRTS